MGWVRLDAQRLWLVSSAGMADDQLKLMQDRAPVSLEAAEASALDGGMYPAAWEKTRAYLVAESITEAVEAAAATDAVTDAAPAPAAVDAADADDDLVEIVLHCSRRTAQRLSEDAERHPSATVISVRDVQA